MKFLNDSDVECKKFLSIKRCNYVVKDSWGYFAAACGHRSCRRAIVPKSTYKILKNFADLKKQMYQPLSNQHLTKCLSKDKCDSKLKLPID